jgi:KN motif and ankyrin repeat domain-containing protein
MLQGNTAIHYAMSNGRFDVVRCLLDSGCCDVGRQNRTGCTAIMLASLVPVSTDDDRQVIERLMTVGDVNQRAALVR